MQQIVNQQRHWAKVRGIVSQITDAQGKLVDTAIVDTLTGILAHGFPTEGSCEGHLDHGEKAPWIDIGKNLPAHYIALFQKKGLPHQPGKPPHVNDVFAMYPALRRLLEHNLQMQAHFRSLLDDFYRTHQPLLPDARLVLTEKGCYGVVRLINQGADQQKIRSPQQQAERLGFYQQEMLAFARFLKKRYYQAKPRSGSHNSTAPKLSAIA